jgi:uncharacterized protein (DUF58 family)
MIYTSIMVPNPDFIRKVRLKNYLLPVVVIGLAIQQYFAPHRAWEILLAAFGGSLLLSVIWTYALWRGLSFKREMRHGWAQVGDKFSEQFTISNKSRFSALAVSLYDHSNFPGYNSSVAWQVGRLFDKFWYMDSVCYKRGLYHVGPTEIHSSDPFGVFEITIKSSRVKEILVTPPIVPLLEIDIASGEWQGNGGTKSKVYERTVTAASVREYVSGDSLFSMHWLTSARRDNLFVRTFDQNPSSDWWIFLDMDRDVQFGEGLETTDEYAVLLAASIADRGLKENRAVGLVGEGSKPLWLPPKTGLGQRAEIMYALALIDRGYKPLKALLAKAQRSMGRKSSAIVVTSSIEPEWLGAITALKSRGVTTTVLLLDPEEFGGLENSSSTLAQLHAWGVRTYSIKKSIYHRPGIQDYFPKQENSLSSPMDKDWGKNL